MDTRSRPWKWTLAATGLETMKDAKSQAANQLNLVNSSRLQALRNKASQSVEFPPAVAEPASAGEDAADAGLQLIIEQRLNEILQQLPAGRQHSLFKIRYGHSPQQLLALPPRQAAAVLRIKLPNKPTHSSIVAARIRR